MQWQPLPSRRHFIPAVLFLVVYIISWSFSGCSKNSNNPKDNKHDSDTIPIVRHYDSAVFYVTFDLWIYNTSGVYIDTFSDHASIKVNIVNGVVSFPPDSIHNEPPIVYPSSGSKGNTTAVWIPDDIGEINIVSATGFVEPGDSIAAIALSEPGTVTPKWQTTSGGITTTFGGVSTPGWPGAFLLKLNIPRNTDEYPFKLVQPGSEWFVWAYRDY
ncbi:MAG TPA: hypothetical protein VNU72_09520 [Puia sp.]|nr:hypothetical protein [Puia sp.]